MLVQFPDVLKNELSCCSCIYSGNPCLIGCRPKNLPFSSPTHPLQEQNRGGIGEKCQAWDIGTSGCGCLRFPYSQCSGEICICGDFKPLNRFLAVDQHPIPRPMDLFSALTGGQKFSRHDLSDTYNQLRLDEQSQRYLVINTHRGLFKYKRLPFGISPAPALFQRIMGKILHSLKGTVFYLDDILVTGANDDEYLRNLIVCVSK